MAAISAGELGVDGVAKRVQEMSTLPHIAMRVLEVVGHEQAGASDLKRVVEGDPSLSARLLRSVNSAASGLRTQVTNLNQAISLLGFSRVRNLAMTASVSAVFKGNVKIGTYDRKVLWKHLVAVGLCARLIAARLKMANFEDAFLAGLLHDIGIVLEDEHVHDDFRLVLARLRGNRLLSDVEQEVLGFTHTRLGERVAENWRFPPMVAAAIRHHHDSSAYTGPHLDIVRCVEAANIICGLKDITSVGQRALRLHSAPFAALGFRKADVAVLAADLEPELSLNESLFEV